MTFLAKISMIKTSFKLVFFMFMDNKVFIKNIASYKNKKITLKGWVFNLRSSGKIVFLQIRDGSGFIQAIVDEGVVAKSVWEKLKKVTLETSLEVVGLVAEHPKGRGFLNFR